MTLLHLLGGDLVLLADRVDDRDPTGHAEPPLGGHQGGELGRGVGAHRGEVAAHAGEERRELIGPVGDDRDPRVSSVSRVSPMSRIDFTPAETTATSSSTARSGRR